MINSVEIIWSIEKILPFAICKIASKLGIHSWNIVIYLRKEWFASRLSRMYMSRQYFHPCLSLLCFNFIHNFQIKNCHSYHFLPKPLVYRRLYKPLTRNVLRCTESLYGNRIKFHTMAKWNSVIRTFTKFYVKFSNRFAGSNMHEIIEDTVSSVASTIGSTK